MLGFLPLASAPLADDGGVQNDVSITVTGVAATASPGSVTVSTDANVVVLGAQARGIVTNVFVWSRLDPDTNPDWTLVDPDTNPDWTLVDPDTNPDWTDVAA